MAHTSQDTGAARDFYTRISSVYDCWPTKMNVARENWVCRCSTHGRVSTFSKSGSEPARPSFHWQRQSEPPERSPALTFRPE